MRAPDLEALIAEGEQEALLDFGYEYVAQIAHDYTLPEFCIDSNDLHARVGYFLSSGTIPADDATKVYDAIWSVKRSLQAEHGPSKTVFRAEEWEEMARLLSRRLDSTQETRDGDTYTVTYRVTV